MISVLEILAEHGKESGNFKIEWTPTLGWRVECGSQWVVSQTSESVESVIAMAMAFMLRSNKPIEPPAEIRSNPTGDMY